MYKRILVPVDGSPTSNLGLEEATRLAKDQGAEILLVHVVNEWAIVSPDASGANLGDVAAGMRESGDRLLDEAESSVRRAGVTVKSVLIEEIGTPVGAAILQQTQEWPADLIVCGTHRRQGVRRLVMGSDAEFLLRHTPIPVLFVRSPEENADG